MTRDELAVVYTLRPEITDPPVTVEFARAAIRLVDDPTPANKADLISVGRDEYRWESAWKRGNPDLPDAA